VIDLGLRRPRAASRRIGLLPADEAPLMEAAPEILRRLELVVKVRNQAGPKTVVEEYLRERVLVLGNRAPTGRNADEIAPDVAKIAVVERISAQSRVDRAARAKRRQRLGIGTRQGNRLARERIEIRCRNRSPWWRRRVACYRITPQRVEDDEDHVAHRSQRIAHRES